MEVVNSVLEKIRSFFEKPLPKFFFPISCILFVYVVIVNSWVTEDAYISFRTVENFLNGFGLRWNTYERVQAYTHPLWLFGLILLSFWTIPVYYSSLILSWICIGTTVYLLFFRFGKKERGFFRGSWIFLVLLTSRAFVDFSSSGLENPLSFLLIILFLEKAFDLENRSEFRDIFLFFFYLSLSYLNRQDTVLLGLPFLLYLYKPLKDKRSYGIFFGASALGVLPVLLWSVFSLVYYGYLFPNTAYAKLNTDLTISLLWPYGMDYLENSFRWDIFTSITIGSAIFLLPYFLWKKKFLHAALSAGIGLYILYICSIGGDFMAGRFFALPFVASVFLFAELSLTFIPRVSVLFFVALFLLNQNSYLYITKDYTRLRNDGEIQDEKGAYFRSTNFIRSIGFQEFPTHGWADVGRKFKKAPKDQDKACATINVGFYGYFAGENRKIIDSNALTDPLLSKLKSVSNWRVGHFTRNIPLGYLESVSSGRNQIQDSDLKVYYERLKLLTESEDLFTKERFMEILRENSGGNRNLIQNSEPRTPWTGIPEGFRCGLGVGY
ncbi:hypothetical protein LEP1GSC185_2764 [Leptospira licerasiae serovar Varillal str. VAR 010]|uniref:Membrane protein n=1 Tax=Leptospira licerasiae str. MMD4847 TaxID=1049971 RepID=A0ABN0H909_9LEPT|nr:hypothetical protein LEP1GSC185_2764 [Leptospira licerasiae serovar Varillal str. VAR 010]EJZ42075.1 putative membrane protein [Leptospira licerasiae str. MMD4847]